MPANPKYLSTSNWQKFLKISAGIIGGYLIAALLHMCASLWLPNPGETLVSSMFSLFMLWCVLLIIPFLFEKGWKAWLLYALIIAVLYVIYYLGIPNNLFV